MSAPRVAVALLALIAAALVGELWLPDRTLAAGDLLIFFPSQYRAPWQGFLHPSVMAGAPAMPNPQTGAWYPPSWPLAMDWFTALPGFIWLHLWLGAVGIWAWTRPHARAAVGPLVAAVAWMACGPTWSLLTKLNVLPAHALLPWLLYGVDQATAGREARGLTVVALALAGGWYGGSAEGVVLAAAVGTLWALPRRRALLATWGGLAIGGGLCLALLVPLAYLLPTTTRAGGLDFATATAMSTPISDWLRVLVADPDWLHQLGDADQHWLVSLYAGLAALALGLLGLRRPGAWRAVLPVALFLFLALGEHNPLYAWFQRLPLVGTIRYPEKWWLGAVPFGAWLVAVGTPTAPRAGPMLLALVTLEGLLSTRAVFPVQRVSSAYADSPAIRAIVAHAGEALPTRIWSESIHASPDLPAVPGEPFHRTVHELVYPNVGARFGLHALYGSWALRSASLDAWVRRALQADIETRHAMLRGAGVRYWIVWDQAEALEIAARTGLRPLPALPGDSLTIGVLVEPDPLPLALRADGGPIEAERTRPGRWLLRTSGEATRLRLAVAWAPGWTLWRGEGPGEEIAPVDGSPWIELDLPPGQHELRLAYRPAGTGLGLAGTGLSLLVLLVVRRRLAPLPDAPDRAQ